MEQLERYCRRDTEALAELVLRESMRIPGGVTSEASVARRLRMAHAEAEREGDDADAQDGDGAGDTNEQRRRPRNEDNGGSSTSDAVRAYDENNRPKRQRKTPYRRMMRWHAGDRGASESSCSTLSAVRWREGQEVSA